MLLARQAWKARRVRAYIKGTAERIDENARQAGVFIEVTTGWRHRLPMERGRPGRIYGSSS